MIQVFYQCDCCGLVIFAEDLEKEFFICPSCTNLLFTKANYYECPQCTAVYLLNEKYPNKKCEICLTELKQLTEKITLQCINCHNHINIKNALREKNYSPFRCINPSCHGIAIKKEFQKAPNSTTIIDRPITQNGKTNQRIGDMLNYIVEEPKSKIKEMDKNTPQQTFITLIGEHPDQTFSLEIYMNPYAFIGREEIITLYNGLYHDYQREWFDLIHPLQLNEEGKSLGEHFILEKVSETDYTIRDRNQPAMTYVQNKLLTPIPSKIELGQSILLPLIVNGQKFGIKLIFEQK